MMLSAIINGTLYADWLRDVGIFADLLAMPPLSDEQPAERPVLAESMEKLATRLNERRSAPN